MLLRRAFGVSAREALGEMPNWEYELLLGSLPSEQEGGG